MPSNGILGRSGHIALVHQRRPIEASNICKSNAQTMSVTGPQRVDAARKRLTMRFTYAWCNESHVKIASDLVI